MLTTEGQTVRLERLGPVEVYQATMPGLLREMGRGEFEAAARRIAELPSSESHYTAELKLDGPPQTAAFAVRLLNDRGHSAGFSNIVAIPVLPALRAPARLLATPAEKAIVLEWPAVPGAASYHIYRSEQPSMPVRPQGVPAPPPAQPLPWSLIGTVEKSGYADENFEFGHEYRYIVRSVAVREGFSAESADSPAAVIRPEDVFPPAVPSGLVGIVTQPAPGQPPAVELSWEPGSEPDLAGYNVFRSDAGAPPRRLNRELLITPALRDTTVKPGIAYSYSVSAVDQKGNESARSEPITVTP